VGQPQTAQRLMVCRYRRHCSCPYEGAASRMVSHIPATALAQNGAAPLGVHAPLFASQSSLLDGDMMQTRQPLLRVSPRLCSQRAQDLALRLGPQGPRLLQGSSPPCREPHRLDPPVGVRRPLDHAGALQEAKAARQRRLVDGELTLQLLQTGLTEAGDRREDAELRHPETTRS